MAHPQQLNSKAKGSDSNHGFTMIELTIVVMIIGALSSIAMPILLNQRNKASTSEAVSKLSSILKQAYTDFQAKESEDTAIVTALLASEQANTAGKFTYGVYRAGGAIATPIPGATDGIDLTPENLLIVGADPNNAANEDRGLVSSSQAGPLTSGKIFGCINLKTGKIDIQKLFKDAVDTNMDGQGTTSTIAGLDCT